MQLNFTPIRHDTPLTLSRTGDVLTLNGEVFDFGPLPEGAVLPASAVESPWFAGDIRREAGVLSVTLLLPHGQNAPQQTLFPAPMSLGRKNGPVALPPYGPQEMQDAAH